METIDLQISKGHQSVIYTEVIKFEEVKLKISIKSDSYDFQSHAKCLIFHKEDLKWNHLYSIPYKNMSTLTSLAYHDNGDHAKHFTKDRDDLLKGAKAILL